MAVEIEVIVNQKWSRCYQCGQCSPILAVLNLDDYYSGQYCKSCLLAAAKLIEDHEVV